MTKLVNPAHLGGQPDPRPPGHLYILLNPSFQEGFLKVGMTTRDPSERAKELSQTSGLPTAFIVAYQEPVSDCRAAEREVHRRLSEFRVKDDREFFRMDLREAITVVSDVAADYRPLPPDCCPQCQGRVRAGAMTHCNPVLGTPNPIFELLSGVCESCGVALYQANGGAWEVSTAG
jgi:T5orf172 domain-containing protein